MSSDSETHEVTAGRPRRGVHWWVRRFFFAWAILSTLWVGNTMRTRGVSAGTLRSTPAVAVSDGDTILEFRPAAAKGASALIFFCGAGVSAAAYAPLLRPVAEAGYPVFIIKLPYRFAPFDSHKETAIDRAGRVIAAHPAVGRWVIAGHSLGGALAARTVHSRPTDIAAVVLIGTTHPKRDDLSALKMPVTKVFASNDGVAPYDRMQATKHLLPTHTRWVEIRGGNHSQFGHYGHQILDGKPTITRTAQQAATRSAILQALANN